MNSISRRGILYLAIAIGLGRHVARAGEPCCGPITAAGQRLAQVLDGMNVESLWLAHEHVDWKTGQPDRSADYDGPGRSTHCSAFAAAVGLRLGVYMLRPPEHGQILLASAQTQWFGSGAAQQVGWKPVDSMQAAQTLANQGKLVVICYATPNPRRPGHIVIVRPSLKSAAELALEGPQVIQAATENRSSSPAAYSFGAHPGAWPSAVQIFAHDV
jgi:hypothetical protein